MNLTDDLLTPKEFELYTKWDLERRLKSNFGKSIVVNHLEKLTSPDGITHEVDLNYEFYIDGIRYLTLVECKCWNKRITREIVKSFKSVKDDLRADKALIVSNSGFQKGAIEFAKIHNIGLVRLTKKNREIVAHFDGGLNRIEEVLLSDSITQIYRHTEPELIGIFYPTQEALVNYLHQTFGSELIQIFSEIEEGKCDLDNPDTIISVEVEKKINSLNDDNFHNYAMVESAGLGFKIENEEFIRILSMYVLCLKEFVQRHRNSFTKF